MRSDAQHGSCARHRQQHKAIAKERRIETNKIKEKGKEE